MQNQANMLISDMDMQRTMDAIISENLQLIKPMLGEVMFAPSDQTSVYVTVSVTQILNLQQLHRQYVEQLRQQAARIDPAEVLARPMPTQKKAAAKKTAVKKAAAKQAAAKNAAAPKKRGRPPGAKNKPKPQPVTQTDADIISQGLSEAQ